MKHIPMQVEVWEAPIVIPTYDVGLPDKNPMFLEKRVYQGSTGKVYPLPVIDKIYDEKKDRTYNAVYLENDYLQIMLLPELGGRVQRAYDKTNGYDFAYYNHVIKPALVGLCGPWISGGIEFNWPQHHRPTTFSPTDYELKENADGSKSVLISEVDEMYGTKVLATFTLYPDKAYLEICGQLYNPTPLPQTFLWWANPAVPVNHDTQSVFPPDVHAVMDHGKRAVSKFPIATGVYYKHDYGEGVDISRYKNIPVPTSYMAYHSDYNFVGGYDYGVQAGILHVADHHISPGKKQWTWGCGDFGQAWDRNLTDEDGPYIELMTGMFTDNQPDFTWLKPFEEKTFTQYFMPYKQAGYVKNASTEIVLNLEIRDGQAEICVYPTARYQKVKILLEKAGKVFFSKTVDISPEEVYLERIANAQGSPSEYTLRVVEESGRELLSYTPQEPQIEKQPDPAEALKDPADIPALEELLLAGLHLEQYRHATYLPDPYYEEGLRRDPLDSRLNNAYGMLLLRRGRFAKAEALFRNAIKRLTRRNPNPYDSEPYYNLGLSLFYQGKDQAAYDAFYKATWTNAQQEMAFYYLGAIALRRQDMATALEHVERALVKNAHNLKARALKGYLLERLGRESERWLKETLALDPFDHVSRILLESVESEDFKRLSRQQPSAYLYVGRILAEWGQYEKAAQTLESCKEPTALLRYYLAYYLHHSGEEQRAREALGAAAKASPLHCFPNHLDDIAVLGYAIQANPEDAKAPYYLANLWYDKRQYEEAISLWESSAKLDGSFPTVWRNLALARFNKQNDPKGALEALEKAFALDTTDARVLLELDQLYQKLGKAPAQRRAFLEKHFDTCLFRDDLYIEYITLLNLLDDPQSAYDRAMGRQFHPWEGGEGKITGQYITALWMLARRAEASGAYELAQKHLQKALHFPANLGEGKLEGATNNNIYYELGKVYQALGDKEKAHEHYHMACRGAFDLSAAMYYNDQPADLLLYRGLAMQKLGMEAEAKACFHKLIDFAEQHLFDEVRIEYFAVSLPNLQIFEEDLNLRNRAHCHYLFGLGKMGLGDWKGATEELKKALSIDPAHMGATLHLQMMEKEERL